MVTYKEISKVGCLIPFGFGRHGIVYLLAVDHKILEGDTLHLSVRAIALNDTERAVGSMIVHITETNVLYRLAGCCTVFLIVGNAEVKQLPTSDGVHLYVLEQHVAHYIVVATNDRHRAVVVHLSLRMLHDTDIAIDKMFNGIHAADNLIGVLRIG